FNGSTYMFHMGDVSAGPGGSSTTPVNGPYKAFGHPAVTLSCTPSSGIGGPCTLSMPDGTQAIYTNFQTPTSNWGGLQSITKPNGEVITLTYYQDSSNYIRSIKSVSSSKGWMLWYNVDSNYAVTNITAFNSAATYCDPNGTSCSPGSSYPSVSQTTSGSTTTIAQNGSTVGTYSISGGITTVTSALGITKTVTTNTTGTYQGRVSSVAIAGSTWNYAYSTDSSGNITTTVTEPNGATHSLVVD